MRASLRRGVAIRRKRGLRHRIASGDDNDIQFTLFASVALEGSSRRRRRRVDVLTKMSFCSKGVRRGKNTLFEGQRSSGGVAFCHTTTTSPARRLYVDLWKAIVREKDEPTNEQTAARPAARPAARMHAS